jgi:hypothetical protein
MKRLSLLVALTVVASACGGRTDTTPRTTVSLPDAQSVTADKAATREDVYKALSQAPELPLRVVQVGADGVVSTTSVFLADGSFEVTYNRPNTAPGAISKSQVIDGSSVVAIVAADGGAIRWISWDDVAATWREAVNNAVPEKYRTELTDAYSEGALENLRMTRVKSTLAAGAEPLKGDAVLKCLEEEAEASQNQNGSWTLACERLATSVTVWLDETGRVSRLDYKGVGSTSSTMTWGAAVESTGLTRIETLNPKASKQDIDALRRSFEQAAKATADELARIDERASEQTGG